VLPATHIPYRFHPPVFPLYLTCSMHFPGFKINTPGHIVVLFLTHLPLYPWGLVLKVTDLFYLEKRSLDAEEGYRVCVPHQQFLHISGLHCEDTGKQMCLGV
jgi:hypothetical protein